MPKYIFDESTLHEFYDEDGMDIANFKREDDGQLSTYEPATCALDTGKLSQVGQEALQELLQLGATKLYVTYDGGSDEGFAHFQKAVTSDGELSAEEIGGRLADGVLGEPRAPRSSAYPVANWSSYQWAQSALDTFIYELATQLLGRSFGTGEYSLEGAFVADLGANILMDTAPTGR